MDKAVSEVLSYIYIFGIVMAVLAVVFVQVNSLVEDTKKSILSQSLEQSFKKIQYTFYSVSFGDAPSQIIEIEMQGGNLALKKSSPTFVVALVNATKNVNNVSGECPKMFRPGCINLTYGYYNLSVNHCSGTFDFAACICNITTGTLEYGYKNWRVALEAGGVFSRYTDTGFSKLLSEPKIVALGLQGGSRVLVLTIPVLNGGLTAGGSGRFRFSAEEGNVSYSSTGKSFGSNSTFNNPSGGLHIFIDDTDYGRAWCKVFDVSKGLIFQGEKAFSTSLTGYNCNSTNPADRCGCGDYAIHVVFRKSIPPDTAWLHIYLIEKEIKVQEV